MKNIAMFLDGTWNDPDDQTSVYRLSKSVSGGATAGQPAQLSYYRNGVGVKKGTKLIGGAFGYGLSENIQHAYDWLRQNYDDEDNIFIFGFSRGAYTARSLGGLIARCGLLRKDAAMLPDDIMARYRRHKDVTRLDEIEHIVRHNIRSLDEEEARLFAESRRVKIRMLGVWDTVGSLGIPWTASPVFAPSHYYFHNTNPSTLYQNCFHALAVDEHRAAYSPTLWTKFVPDDEDPDNAILPARKNFEQRWFIGAHANVGGGYKNDPLCNLPLAWMQEKATGCGLRFSQPVAMTDKELDTKEIDSYAKFMFGAYRLAKFGKRFHRPIGAGKQKVNGGWSIPINETIDASVFARWNRHSGYRPHNLLQWGERNGRRIETINGEQPA